MLSEFSGMSHDGAGNRVAQTNDIPAVPSYSGTTAYQYDVKDQVTRESSTRLGGFISNFGFDNAGNPVSFKGTTNTFNSNNQNAANTYDLNGNPTSYLGVSAAYDAADRMTSYGSVMTAGYNAEGLRAWKQNASGRTYFLYAEGVLPICELDASGNVTAVNSVSEGGLLARHSSAASTFYAFDPQGSPSHRLDSSGAILSTSSFDAFGVRATNDTSGDPFAGFGAQFGYRSDFETGLQLVGMRCYDTTTGRFVTRDPVGYDGGANLYSYASNQPVDYIDPDGRSAIIHEPSTRNGPQGHWFIRLDAYCNALPKFSDKGYPHQAIGLYPSQRKPPGYRFNPSVSIGAINNGPGNYCGQDPAIDPDPMHHRSGRTGPIWGGFQRSDSAFEKALCECISEAMGNPPPFRIPSYMCPKFATDLWDCALGKLTNPKRRFEPSVK